MGDWHCFAIGAKHHRRRLIPGKAGSARIAGMRSRTQLNVAFETQVKCEMGDDEAVFIRNRQNVSIGFLLCKKEL